jgi:anti-sigma factor RsiW
VSVVIPLLASVHRQVDRLLPWYVNGTLDETELALVTAHVAQCARCQADVVWQERLRAPALHADELAMRADVDRSWAQLSRRLAIGKPARTAPVDMLERAAIRFRAAPQFRFDKEAYDTRFCFTSGNASARSLLRLGG